MKKQIDGESIINVGVIPGNSEWSASPAPLARPPHANHLIKSMKLVKVRVNSKYRTWYDTLSGGYLESTLNNVQSRYVIVSSRSICHAKVLA